jgi:hypothetical protein
MNIRANIVEPGLQPIRRVSLAEFSRLYLGATVACGEKPISERAQMPDATQDSFAEHVFCAMSKPQRFDESSPSVGTSFCPEGLPPRNRVGVLDNPRAADATASDLSPADVSVDLS